MKIASNNIIYNYAPAMKMKPQISKAHIATDTVCAKINIPELLDEYIDKIMAISKYDLPAQYRFKQLLNKILPALMSPTNFINEGKDSKVYQISDKYVARINKRKKTKNLIHFYNIVHRPNILYKDINIYYGEPIIKVGNVQILKNATPTQDSHICGLSFGPREFQQEEIKEYETKFLKYCSSLPQECYDKLALGLQKLNKLSSKTGNICNPDIFNPNNLIISNGEFRFVDKLTKSPLNEPNNLYTMLVPLLIKISAYVTATPNHDVTDLRKIIYNKCLLAAKKAGFKESDSTSLKNYYNEILNNILENKVKQ